MKKYIRTNRLHSLTRWPADPTARMSLAITDLVFVRDCGFSMTPGMLAIESEAERQIAKAERELRKRDHEQRPQ